MNQKLLENVCEDFGLSQNFNANYLEERDSKAL
jgi:hypothetical protein